LPAEPVEAFLVKLLELSFSTPLEATVTITAGYYLISFFCYFLFYIIPGVTATDCCRYKLKIFHPKLFPLITNSLRLLQKSIVGYILINPSFS